MLPSGPDLTWLDVTHCLAWLLGHSCQGFVATLCWKEKQLLIVCHTKSLLHRSTARHIYGVRTKFLFSPGGTIRVFHKTSLASFLINHLCSVLFLSSRFFFYCSSVLKTYPNVIFAFHRYSKLQSPFTGLSTRAKNKRGSSQIQGFKYQNMIKVIWFY